MNDKKIAFITCVSDESEYAECRFYLERLHIPEGYAVDYLCIQDAPSMAAGYNAAMEDSDAKYKVYLHQDVFIKYVNFIPDLLAVFAGDPQVGIVGVVGKTEMGTTALGIMEWDVGNVIHNHEIMDLNFPEQGDFAQVAAADGLLLATQYDIPRRADIFDGWNFYDISQCMEFRKRGYKVAVPRQKEIWCCHDALGSKFTDYFAYYDRFLLEYGEAAGIAGERTTEELLESKRIVEYARQLPQLREALEALVNAGEKAGLREFFQNPDFQRFAHLREYEDIVDIDWMEEKNHSGQRFWTPGMSASRLVLKLRALKYALKRIKYGADEGEDAWIREHYSLYAVVRACIQYTTYKDKILQKLGIVL